MRRLSTGLLFVGVSCVAVFVHASVVSAIKAERALEIFDASSIRALQSAAPRPHEQIESTSKRSLAAKGVLRIDALGIDAPIFQGTSEAILKVGIGHIEGTAPLISNGNIGLAAHRDSFFRGLKDTAIGQKIELRTPTGARIFEVEAIEIVLPSALSVLAPADQTQLTLITCYPFYYLGNAPKRFVVFAREVPTIL